LLNTDYKGWWKNYNIYTGHLRAFTPWTLGNDDDDNDDII